MTIEQKAKAYDEAIKKIRKGIQPLQDGSKISGVTNGFLEEVFPELKESEDERIRESLLGYLHTLPNHYSHDGVCVPEWIAWLEKQEGCEYIKKDWLEHIKQSWYKEGFIDGKYSGGTSKEWTINDAAIFKEIIDFLENGTAKLQHDLTKYANWLKIQFTPIEKQGRQFSVDKLEPKFKVGDVMRTLQEAANNITSGLPVVVSIDEEYYHCTNELIAIKDQDDYEYPPMNRAIAWSEEDEEFLRRAINATKDIYPMTANWLKSLKDRFTWKPSEEQMIALRQVISGCSYDIEPLLELETKLKEF